MAFHLYSSLSFPLEKGRHSRPELLCTAVPIVALLLFPEAYGLLLDHPEVLNIFPQKPPSTLCGGVFPLPFPRYSGPLALSLSFDFPLNPNAFSAIPHYITAWRSWTIPHFFPEYQPLLHLSNSVQRTRLLGISFALSLYLSIGRNLSYPIPCHFFTPPQPFVVSISPFVHMFVHRNSVVSALFLFFGGLCPPFLSFPPDLQVRITLCYS